jgi:hypothetical protein
MFKSLNKIKPQSPKEKSSRYTYGAQIFPPDYSATVLGAKLCANSHKYYISMTKPWSSTLNFMRPNLEIISFFLDAKLPKKLLRCPRVARCRVS